MNRVALHPRKYIFIFILTIMFISICVVHAVSAGEYVNFFPINGTFQNFNPIRRFLDGQIPYKDFEDYLGLGHLYLGAIATFIFGGDYQASLVAFSFLTFFSFGLIVFSVGYCVTHNKVFTLVITNLIMVLTLIRPPFFSNTIAGTNEFKEALDAVTMGPGNSARLVRGIVLPFSCVLILFLLCLIRNTNNRRILARSNFFQLLAVGIVAGLSFVWSNDHGVSSWVCLSIITFFTAYSRTKNLPTAFKALLLEVFISIITIIVVIEILTANNLGDWFRSLTGTGGYQAWYYNSEKTFYLWQVDIFYYILFQAFLALYYLYRLYQHRGSYDAICRYGSMAFFNMECFCVANEYHLISGGFLREVPLIILFATLIFEGVHLLSHLVKMRHKAVYSYVLIAFFCLSFVVSSIKDDLVANFNTEKSGIYVEPLGGYITEFGDDLLETTEYIGDEKIFSTYASAQEVFLDTYQPSGTDYIIHVLGDSARERYLESFATDDFKYVTTIQDSFTYWEAWIRRANWFFYRKLYEAWHPVYNNTYLKLWERNAENQSYIVDDNISVEIITINDQAKKIILRAEADVSGTADVYIKYQVRKKDTISSKFLIRTMLHISYSDDGQNYSYLPSSSEEYIPIDITNGYGEIVLTSMPEKDTYLEIDTASCERIFTVLYDNPYLMASNLSDENWTNGVSNTGNILLFPSSVREQLQNAKHLTVGSYTVDIIGIEDKGEWIHVLCDSKDLQAFAYPNEITIS